MITIKILVLCVVFVLWFVSGVAELKESEAEKSRTGIIISFFGGLLLPFVGVTGAFACLILR